MFVIQTAGVRKPRHRVVSTEALRTSEFKRIARQLGITPIRARKVAFVAARCAKKAETIDTYWNGKETTNIARRGDWIATSLTRRKTILRDKRRNANTYVIKAATFEKLYEKTKGKNRFGRYFKSKSVVTAIYLSAGFDIVAPWGQRERAPKGYLVINGKEIYGNNAAIFEATYEVVRA
jgi:hypothetical protein